MLGAQGFSSSLDILYGGVGISKLQFLTKKDIKKFQLYFFSLIFWSSKPWILILIRIRLKCWIRIRIRITLNNLSCKDVPHTYCIMAAMEL